MIVHPISSVTFVTGIPVAAGVTLEFHTMRRKELAVLNVRRSNHESDAALELLRGHASLFAPILTHALPLERIESAFEMLEHYEDGAGKVVIRP